MKNVKYLCLLDDLICNETLCIRVFVGMPASTTFESIFVYFPLFLSVRHHFTDRKFIFCRYLRSFHRINVFYCNLYQASEREQPKWVEGQWGCWYYGWATISLLWIRSFHFYNAFFDLKTLALLGLRIDCPHYPLSMSMDFISFSE